jgi:hypothetical protein
MRKISSSHLLDNWRQDIRKTKFLCDSKNLYEKKILYKISGESWKNGINLIRCTLDSKKIESDSGEFTLRQHEYL